MTYQDGVFQSATAWGTPTLVASVQVLSQQAPTAPTAPSGGTRTATHLPSGWSATKPSATALQSVYRSQRIVTYRNGVFQSATVWSTPIRVTASLSASLIGYVDVGARLQSRPLTLYGWAYNMAAATAPISVEIYVGGARGTGTLAATVTADRPRADVNRVLGITGDHGFAWAVPTQYQSSAQEFSVYVLDRTPNPTVRTPLSNSPLTLLAPGAEEYCTNHGPCISGGGDCDDDTECQTGTTCVADVGASYGFGATVDVCEGGTWDFCSSTKPCAAGLGDCDNDSDCQSGITCMHDVGASYGYPADMDVCEAATTTATQSIYQRATSPPATPSGGTRTEHHVPRGWSTTQPRATTTAGVYRSQRTVTYRGGVFQSATAWGTPTRVTAPTAVSLGHVDYCRDQGPCRAGQGECDSDSDCQSGLTCADDVGTHYGWTRLTDVCEASRTLRGHFDLIGELNGRPPTAYGWAVDPLRSLGAIPVEIYVGGPRGRGRLAATIMANRPRADVNRVLGVTGNHGFAWLLPARYRTGRHRFYVYAVDTTPNPNWRTHLNDSPRPGP